MLFGSKITLVDRSIEKIESTSWPFTQLKFALARTGEKIATHIHLNQLRLREIEALRLPVRMVWQGMIEADEDMFLSGLNRFAERLEKKDWVAPSTRSLMKRLSFIEEIVGMKGCGALGADVLFIAYRSTPDSDLLRQLKDLGLEIVATSDDLCPGFEKARPDKVPKEVTL